MEEDNCTTSGLLGFSPSSSSSSPSSSSSSSFSDFFWLYSPCPSFEFFMCTVVVGLVCLVGLVGNTLSFAVLGTDGQNRVASFLLQSLAVADNSLLVVSAFVLSSVLGPYQVPSAARALRRVVPYLKKYVNPFGPITQSCTIWMTVLLAVNRYIVVCRPFSSRRLLTLRNARIQVLSVVVLSAVLNVPRFFQYDVIYLTENNVTVPRKQLTQLGRNVPFDVGYFQVFSNVVVLVVPLVALVALNARIACDMQRSMSNMRRNSLHYAGRQERNVTMVMLIIVVKLIAFHAPVRILSAVKLVEIHRGSDNIVCPHPVIYAAHFANLLVILSSSTDFFVYCVFRKRFRRLFCVRFCCCCRTRMKSGWTLKGLEQTPPVECPTQQPSVRNASSRLLSRSNSIASRRHDSIQSLDGDANSLRSPLP